MKKTIASYPIQRKGIDKWLPISLKEDLDMTQYIIAGDKMVVSKSKWITLCLALFFFYPSGAAALQFAPTRSLTAGWPGDLPDKTRVAYNSRHREYLVVYQYHNSILPGPDQIHAARLSASGEYIANYVISDLPNSCIQPDVAYDPVFDRYLVVWSYDTANDGTDYGWDIYGQFIPWSGPTDTLASFEVANGVDEHPGSFHLEVAEKNPRISHDANNKTFLIVMEAFPVGSSKSYITGTKVVASGANHWQNLTILVGDSFAHPDVAYDSYKDEFLVVFDVEDLASRMIYGVFVPGEQAPGTHDELRFYSQLTPISVGQMLYGGHSLPAISFCPVTNMFLIVWVTNRHVDSGEIFARYLPSRAFVPPSQTSYLERLDTGGSDFVNLVDVACGANTGWLPNNRNTGDCLVTWTLRHDNSFWSFGRQLTIVASPIAQLFSHATGFYGPLHNLGALSSWGTDEPRIGVASGPDNFSTIFTGLDGFSVKRTFSRLSTAPAGWSTVTASNHSLGIRSDGSLWAWGWNHFGQLGLGDTGDRNTPVRVGTANNWISVTAGYYHSLGIRTDGSLWAWGWNSYGQLGTGGLYAGENTPTRVGTLSDWIAVSAGYSHSLGIRTDGSLWAWGINDKYQLGLGDTNNRNTPVRVGSFNDWIAVAAGTDCSFGIRLNGSLWSWGGNTHGQLGMGDHNSRMSPTQVGSSNNWVAIKAGYYHSLGIRSDGALYSWGNNQQGQLGLNDSVERDIPSRIGTSNNWINMAAGGNFSLGLLSNGTPYTSVWAWGHNNWGQLGIGNTVSKQVPTEIHGIPGNCIAISSGFNSSLCISADGSLWSWGGNLDGQLGVGDNENKNTPTQVFLPKTKKFPWTMFLPAMIGHK